MKDYFVVDDDHTHEDNINTIAHHGITNGCNEDGTHYCPDDPVTRAQIASLLTKALDLSPPEDPNEATYADTAGNTHEDNIRAATHHGAMSGCDEDGNMFCAQSISTRGLIASFLSGGPVGALTSTIMAS